MAKSSSWSSSSRSTPSARCRAAVAETSQERVGRSAGRAHVGPRPRSRCPRRASSRTGILVTGPRPSALSTRRTSLISLRGPPAGSERPRSRARRPSARRGCRPGSRQARTCHVPGARLEVERTLLSDSTSTRRLVSSSAMAIARHTPSVSRWGPSQGLARAPVRAGPRRGTVKVPRDRALGRQLDGRVRRRKHVLVGSKERLRLRSAKAHRR